MLPNGDTDDDQDDDSNDPPAAAFGLCLNHAKELPDQRAGLLHGNNTI
jgi:hypothetical protein